jgi:hypothetical protein
MKEERMNTSLVLLGLKTRLDSDMPINQPENIKQFKKGKRTNERKRKTKQGRRSNDECHPHQDAKVPQEKGTRLGGSTTHLLPEPRANGFQGIERYDTPPSVEEQMRTAQKMLNDANMERYTNALRRLTEVSGGGRSYPEREKEQLNRTIKVGEVYAIRCPDNNDFYRTILIKKNHSSAGHQALISNALYGTTPDGITEVAQELIHKRIRELNASTTGTSMEAFPFKGASMPTQGFIGNGSVSQNHLDQLKRRTQ